MKKTTKMMSLVFVFALLCAVFCFNASAFTAEEVTYEIKNNEVYITAVNAEVTEDIVIPDIVEDLPVVAICEGVFENCVQIKTIALPATLKIIEENAFGGCTEIETIYFAGTNEAWVEGIYELPETTNRITVHYNSQDHEHIWQEEITPATCTSKGFTKNYCECGEYYYSDYIEASGEHSYIINTTPATTTSDGVIETTCENCDYYNSEVIAKIKSVTLSTSECVYNGKVRTPSVKVKDENGKTLVLETDYTVSYADGRKTPGRYAIYANFQGNYSGKVKLVFTILPKAATSLKATQKTASITLTWGKVTGATGYRVYQYSPSKDTYVQKASIKGTNTYTISSLKAGTTYKFKIRAYTKTSSGVVLWAEDSKEFTTATAPKTPTKISATQNTSVINLKWNATTGSTGYRVYQYSSSKKKYVQIASVKTTSYKKTTNLKAGTTYKFKIKPYVKLSDGTVIWGTASSEFVTTTKPAKVTNVKATTTPFTIKLTWGKVTGATGYKVYAYNSSKKKYEEIDKTSKNSYTFDYLNSATTYKFKVKAYKTLSGKTYEGDASEAYSAKTKTATVAENNAQLKKNIKHFGHKNAQGNYVITREHNDGKYYNTWGIVYNESTGKFDYLFYSAPLYLDGSEDIIQFSVTSSTTSTTVEAATINYKDGYAYEAALATATLKPKTYTAKTQLDFKFDSESSPSLKNAETEEYFNYLLQWSFEIWDGMVEYEIGTGLSGVGFTAYK